MNEKQHIDETIQNNAKRLAEICISVQQKRAEIRSKSESIRYMGQYIDTNRRSGDYKDIQETEDDIEKYERQIDKLNEQIKELEQEQQKIQTQQKNLLLLKKNNYQRQLTISFPEFQK